MFTRRLFARITGASAALWVAGCGAGDGGKSHYLSDLGDATFVPECEDYDHEPCAIEEPDCQHRLAELAACVWGGPGTDPVEPDVDFVSQADYREEVLERLVELRDLSAGEDRWADAWVMLGLATNEGLDDEALADFTSEVVFGYYESDSEQIRIVLPEEPPEELAYSSAGLVHEYIHALQDDADDLDSLWEDQPMSSDAAWGLSSLVEGEAEFHQTRVLVAMFGLDLESLDLRLALRNFRLGYEASVFEGQEPLLESRGLINYAYGPESCYHVWEAEGRAGVRELFESPPDSFYGAFARVRSPSSPDVEPVVFVEPVIEGNVAAGVYDVDSLGPWGIHLMLRGADEDLALAWRGDQLAVFELNNGDTGVRWQFEFAEDDDASRFAAALFNLSTYVDGTRVVLAAAPGDYSWLLEPGEIEQPE